MTIKYSDEFFIETLKVSIQAEEEALYDGDYENAAEMLEIQETLQTLKKALKQAYINYGPKKNKQPKENKNDTLVF